MGPVGVGLGVARQVSRLGPGRPLAVEGGVELLFVL